MKASPSYLLKVTLTKTPKLIWRRLVVPSDIRLDHLHEILQTVMGWLEPRPHVFFHGKQGFHPTGSVPDGGIPEKKYTLANLIVRSGGKLKYIVDPAEEKWTHEIVVENIRFSDPARPFPICCIGGVRACPPVGIGGVDGLAHLLRVLDGKAEHTEATRRFADFQPDRFDLESVNRSFGVEGPRQSDQQSFESQNPNLKSKKSTSTSKRTDPLYRLGQKLKMATQSGGK